MRKPNFFIVGAPKCGTTALHHYLKAHPNIYMPNVKEPHYFAVDLPGHRLRKSESEYLRLFRPAGPRHLAVGEASVLSMYSKVAIKKICQFNVSARLIAMVRNPVEMIYSLHSTLLYYFGEDERNFERAWNLQAERCKGRHIPPRCLDAALLQYRDVAMLGEQVERLLDIFPSRQVKIILFDDFSSSPKQVYEEVLEFLAVPSDGRTEFPRINESNVHRSQAVGKLLHAMLSVQNFLRAKFDIGLLDNSTLLTKLNLLAKLRNLNSRPVSRPPLSREFRQELVQVFRDDVRKLFEILGRDPNHWQA